MNIDNDYEHLVNAYTPPQFSRHFFEALNFGNSYEEAESYAIKQFSVYSTETPNKDIGMLKLNRTKDSGCKHESNAIQGFGDSSTETTKGDV